MRFIVFLFIIQAFNSTAQDFNKIKSRLEQINIESIKLRRQVMPTINEFGIDSDEKVELDRKIVEFDSIALEYVRGIVDNYGWLGKSEIGDLANQTLFLVIQHSQNAKVRKDYFPLLEKSVKMNDSDASYMATMKDRMLVEEGQNQLYGTQSRLVNGNLELHPIEDPENVNKRRKAVGLKKLKRY